MQVHGVCGVSPSYGGNLGVIHCHVARNDIWFCLQVFPENREFFLWVSSPSRKHCQSLENKGKKSGVFGFLRHSIVSPVCLLGTELHSTLMSQAQSTLHRNLPGRELHPTLRLGVGVKNPVSYRAFATEVCLGQKANPSLRG